MKNNITQNELKELFIYDNGNLICIKKYSRSLKIGTAIGSLGTDGYVRVAINKNKYLLHRIMWIYFNGYIPEDMQIDHINRNKADNRIENLRLVTIQENQFNRNDKGYCLNKISNKFQAQISINRKTKHLGMYDTEEEARFAYLEAKKKYHIIKES